MSKLIKSKIFAIFVPINFMVSQLGHAQAINEILPPDYFKHLSQADAVEPEEIDEFALPRQRLYRFPTELEKPCASKSGFCPNYDQPGGMPKEWLLARYKSRHAGGFDSGTPSLLMVYIPPGVKVRGTVDRVHRWLNFPLPADQGDDIGQPTPKAPIPNDYLESVLRTFTMVSITEGTPAKVHFSKFARMGDTDKWLFGGTLPKSELKGCYRCHPNGLRAISPLGYHVNASEAADVSKMLGANNWRMVKLINDAMVESARGQVQWDQGFDPTDTTVAMMGEISHVGRGRDFILGTAGQEACSVVGNSADCGCARMQDMHKIIDIFSRPPGLNNIYTMDRSVPLNYETIRDAMNCTSCHNNISRGAINKQITFSQIAFKVLVDQSMPAGYHGNPLDSGTQFNRLDVNHRIALLNCLKKEISLNSINR